MFMFSLFVAITPSNTETTGLHVVSYLMQNLIVGWTGWCMGRVFGERVKEVVVVEV
jgi:hypothetical protein